VSNAIPPYRDFMRLLLELLNRTAGPAKAGDITVKLADEMKLSEEARTQLLPSGKQATYKNRIGWACTYLTFAGLVGSPARGQWVLTDAGEKLLAAHKGVGARALISSGSDCSARRRVARESKDQLTVRLEFRYETSDGTERGRLVWGYTGIRQ
jgi:restriction endonuclease Mrr